MRTVLVNLPWEENGYLGVRAGSRWPFKSLPEKDGNIHYIPFPFFLAYSNSLLKKHNKEAVIIDAVAEGIKKEKFIDRLYSFSPDLIVVETSTPSFRNDLEIIERIHSNLPNSQITLCGPHASVFPREILEEYSFIDYILIGEYEYSLLELVDCLESNSALQDILGLAYRHSYGVKINTSRPTIANLDSLPWPERESLPIYKYNDGFAGLHSPSVQMWASRGCPFRCIFCLWPQVMYKEHKYRKRDPIDVVDEMQWLIDRFNFKAVYFDDDVFNIDRDYVFEICGQIKRRKVNIPWAMMARADLMDKEVLEILASAGLYAVKYGVESASEEILGYSKKNIDIDKTRCIIRVTKKLGIKVHLTFCLGLPGETKQTIQETIGFIESTQPDSYQISFAMPFPGTEYFNYLKDKGWLVSNDWSDFDGNYKCVVRTEELSNSYLEEIRSILCNNF